MSRLYLLILTVLLSIVGPLSGQVEARTIHPESAARCAACCTARPGDCGMVLAACERICAVAVIPAVPEITRRKAVGLAGPLLTQALTSLSGKPVPPPPRARAHLL
jgi:hypothetical protein